MNLKQILTDHAKWIRDRYTGKRANLMNADLTYAYLVNADLAGAYLKGACLTNADLRGANLKGANLMGVSLRKADLAEAHLTNADLREANLAEAHLASVDLRGAQGVIDAGAPNTWRCVGWLRDGVLSVRVGCHDKRLAEGREYWFGKEDRREVLAALDYVEAVAKLRGWKTE